MISRNGTRTSGASSGVTKILRDEGSGPVVTAGSVVSGLERMFMGYPPVNFVVRIGHCSQPSLRGALATKQSLSLIHISEPTRLGMISYAVFCLKKKKKKKKKKIKQK